MRHFLDSTSPHLPFRWMASGAPHALHRFLVVRSLAAAIVLVGCVPAAKYEEAQSATEVAREAERRTQARLAEVEAELEALQEDHAAARQRLAEYDTEAAQAALDRTHLEQQRDEHAELVDQLRTELARVGDHLRVYSEDRATLSERLGEAQTEIERLQERVEDLREAAAKQAAEAAEREAAEREAAERKSEKGPAADASSPPRRAAGGDDGGPARAAASPAKGKPAPKGEAPPSKASAAPDGSPEER